MYHILYALRMKNGLLVQAAGTARRKTLDTCKSPTRALFCQGSTRDLYGLLVQAAGRALHENRPRAHCALRKTSGVMPKYAIPANVVLSRLSKFVLSLPENVRLKSGLDYEWYADLVPPGQFFKFRKIYIRGMFYAFLQIAGLRQNQPRIQGCCHTQTALILL